MEQNLGFVITDIARLMRKRFGDYARDIAVTGPQWRALLNVARVPGIKQSALAERLDVEPITTCRMIDRLEQAGMVERSRDPDDRRAWQLHLTEAASPIIDALSHYGDSLQDHALRDFTDAERHVLNGLLMRIRDNLGDETEIAQRSASHG